MDVKTVGVVGAGTMGSGIAQVMAASGIDVVLNDIDEAAVKRALSTSRRRLSAARVEGCDERESDRAAALARINDLDPPCGPAANATSSSRRRPKTST